MHTTAPGVVDGDGDADVDGGGVAHIADGGGGCELVMVIVLVLDRLHVQHLMLCTALTLASIKKLASKPGHGTTKTN